jgi:hypothetical protein
MNLSEFGTVLSPSDLGGARSARTSRGQRAYDNLSGSAVLRRTGKAAVLGAPRRGDQASAPFAARRGGEAENGGEDRLGAHLREFYHALLSEPAPERLVATVEELAAGRGR